MSIARQESPVRTIEFGPLLMDSSAGVQNPLEMFMTEVGVVYVTAVTRDGCGDCVSQEPKFRRLARMVSSQYPGEVEFNRVHVPWTTDNKEMTRLAQELLGVVCYPTNMVHVRSDANFLIPIYWAMGPSMRELGGHIRENGIWMARLYRNRAQELA